MAVQRVLPRLVQRLVCHRHDLGSTRLRVIATKVEQCLVLTYDKAEAAHLVKYGVDISMLPLLLALIPLGGGRAGCQTLLAAHHAPHPIVLLWVEHHPPLLLLHP